MAVREIQVFPTGHGRGHCLAGPSAGGDVPVVFFHALRIKMREDGVLRNNRLRSFGRATGWHVRYPGTQDILIGFPTRRRRPASCTQRRGCAGRVGGLRIRGMGAPRRQCCEAHVTPCGYRDAEEACLPAVQRTGLSRSPRHAITGEGFGKVRGRARRLPPACRWWQQLRSAHRDDPQTRRKKARKGQPFGLRPMQHGVHRNVRAC